VRVDPTLPDTVGTALSLVPGLIAISVFGKEVAQALNDPSEINPWQVGLTLLAFGVFTWWIRRWLLKREEQMKKEGTAPA